MMVERPREKHESVEGRGPAGRHFFNTVTTGFVSAWTSVGGEPGIAPRERRVFMKSSVMSGMWRYIIKVPSSMFEKQVARGKSKIESELRFMSADHRVVHHFVVRELPRLGKPLSPEYIAQNLSMDLEKVTSVLNDLEEHMTFLFRNDDRHVLWAYPVTAEKTPHHLSFSTGEQIHAA